MNNLERTITPADIFYSKNPAVYQIMRSIREDIGNDVVRSVRYMTCADVGEILPQYPSVYERVNLLRDIARKNNDFIDNWRTGEMPPIFLAGSFLRILHDESITEDDFSRIGAIVEMGLSRDHHCIDDGVAAILCGRKFPPDMRERMFQKMVGASCIPYKKAPNRSPNRHLITHKVLSAYFSRSKNQNGIIGVPVDKMKNAMKWALEEYERRPSVLSDIMLSTYMLHEEIPYEDVDSLMKFIIRNSGTRRYNERDYNIGSLKVYNAFYTRALDEPDRVTPDIAKIPLSVMKNAEPGDMDYYLYLEKRIMSRKHINA